MSGPSMIGRSVMGGLHTGRDRHTDPLARLRFAIETMPGSRKYQFTPSTRLEVLQELYSAFWGPYMDLFLPNHTGPMVGLLSDVQKAAVDPDDAVIPGKPCGRIFKKGDSCYRCRDCAIDDSTVLCSRCFHASDHTGHNVTFYIAVQPGGVCDCGEVEAWKTPVACRAHPPVDPSPTGTPKHGTSRSAAIVDQWALRNRANVPHELRDIMSRTVAYALDFVLDTLDFSPSEISAPLTEVDLKRIPTADPIPNDLFAIVVWNDEKHSYDETVAHLQDAIGCSVDDATEYVNRLDAEGRTVVEISATVPRLLAAAKQIAGIELGVTVRRAFDTFREQVSAVIIEWLIDLMQCRLLNDSIILRDVVAAEVYAPRKKDSSSLTSNQEATKVLSEVKDPARLDWLFLYHAKTWRRVRLNLKRIIVSMATINHEHRLTVAVHFATVYHRIIDNYLLVDREAESSIKYFSVQIFTIPSVAAYIVRHHNIIQRLLSIITSFFTNQIQNKRIIHPPDPTRRVEVESQPFKSKRFMPVFSDLRYIVTNKTIHELIARHQDYIAQFIPVCQIFMGINPNKRAATSHVEYETESWISVFNVTLSLSRVVKVYGEAFAQASPKDLKYAVLAVIHAILATCTLTNDQLDKTKYSPITFHTVQFGSTEYQTIHFDVLSQWVSFHHSLHWLLAELLKHVHLLSEEALATIGMKNLRDVILRNASERAVLTVIDFPLRVITMVAQIRTGLWVRNGFAIRGQLLHYRDFMLRELCYDQDLYLLQTAFVILEPNLVLVSLLDRFQLTEWFSGEATHPIYDDNQTFGMVEEFLYVVITCLSEFANARHLTPIEVVRREVLHGLALGPCSFTELCKRVAERIVDDSNLDKALSTVANYRPPKGATDFGVYELRDDVFDEVNPFFFHYTRNRREEAEAVLKARLTKKTGVEAPVIVPRPMRVESGPFVNLNTTFHSEVLLQVIFFCFKNVISHAEATGSVAASADAVVDQVLHLIMLGLVETPGAFVHILVNNTFDSEKNTAFDMLCKLEITEPFKSFRSKVQWCLAEIAKYVPREVMEHRRYPAPAEPAEDPEEARRRAAKARQAKIMQQFAAAQKTFLDQYDDEDDDDDEASGSPKTEPCIVCQDELDGSRPFGVLGFIQPSRIIKRMPDPRWELLERNLECPASLDRPVPVPSPVDHPRLPPAEGVAPFGTTPSEESRFGLYGSVCGHLMHVECFSVYSNSIEQRHQSQPTRNHPEVVERKEFLCPLCKSLGNVVLPVIPAPHDVAPSSQSLNEWMRKVRTELLIAEIDRERDSILHPYTQEFVFWGAEDPGSLPFTPTTQMDSLHRIVETVDNIIRPLSTQVPHLRDRTDPPTGQRGRGLYLPEEFIAYTICCTEVAQRGQGQEGSCLTDNINEPTIMRCIRGLIACLTKRAELEFPRRHDGGRRALQHAIMKRLLSSDVRPETFTSIQPLLLQDPLSLLVETAAIVPESLPQVTIVAYYAFLARTAISLVEFLSQLSSDTPLPPMELTHPTLFGDSVRIFVLSVCRHHTLLEHSAEAALRYFGEGRFERLLYAHSLPFLRCALLLNRAVLPTPNGSTPDPSAQEYDRLLHLLNVPPLAEISSPQCEALRGVLATWCQHFGAQYKVYPRYRPILLDHPGIYRLALLPSALDSVFIKDSEALRCTRCDTIPNDPAICVICGTVCCNQSHCCMDVDDAKQGECNMHTRECGGAIGFYLLVKRSILLYLYSSNGSFSQPPYLDVHGELDYTMRRGRRQYLHAARYEEVRKTWLNHGVPTLVARKLDGTIDVGGWDTV